MDRVPPRNSIQVPGQDLTEISSLVTPGPVTSSDGDESENDQNQSTMNKTCSVNSKNTVNTHNTASVLNRHTPAGSTMMSQVSLSNNSEDMTLNLTGHNDIDEDETVTELQLVTPGLGSPGMQNRLLMNQNQFNHRTSTVPQR